MVRFIPDIFSMTIHQAFRRFEITDSERTSGLLATSGGMNMPNGQNPANDLVTNRCLFPANRQSLRPYLPIVKGYQSHYRFHAIQTEASFFRRRASLQQKRQSPLCWLRFGIPAREPNFALAPTVRFWEKSPKSQSPLSSQCHRSGTRSRTEINYPPSEAFHPPWRENFPGLPRHLHISTFRPFRSNHEILPTLFTNSSAQIPNLSRAPAVPRG
jgi:hypothetical protein